MALSASRRFLIAALVAGAVLSAPVRAGAEGVLVFAAASLKTALDLVVSEFHLETGQEVTVSYAASSVLSRQLQLGAPADLFVSANPGWMDVLQAEGRIDPETRVDLLGNGLVLIGAAGRAPASQIGSGYDLLAELNGGFLAMALVDAVPAGLYGKAALQNLGLWDGVQDRVAQADNARAALALVATGAAPAGVVYQSDAKADARVQVIATFPAEAHPPIVYPAAAMQSAGAEARAFLRYLRSDRAMEIFLGQGFSLPGRR